MKFTLSWLKDHLDTTASLDEIVDKLTMIGLEVERVEDKATEYEPFKVVQILEAVQHPNADRLRVCKVDNGTGTPLQIVCGAPNARAGLKTVLGLPGTYIPAKDITLSVGKIRGVESQGMMISGAEIGFDDDHSGIIEMPEDAPIGKPFAEVLGSREPVIEINLTPNRSDCTGVNGIARDLGATLIGDYKENAPKRIAGKFPCPVKVTIDGSRRCARPSACGWCAASRTGRRPTGCRSGSPPSACGRSTRWSTSPTTSPSTAAGRCTCSTPRRSPAISPSAARTTARRSSRSTARPTRSTRPCA